ncbi:calcium channel protein, partial [Lobosporangium transversale]
MSMNHETDPTATSISTTDPANNNDNNVDTEADQPPSLNIVNTTSPHSISLQQQQQQHCSLKDPLYSSSGSYAVTSTPLPRQSRLFLQAPGQYSQLSSLNHHSSNSDNSRSNNNPELLPGPIAPSSPPHLNLLDNSGQQHHHQHHVVFSNISPNHSQESFNDAERLSENEGLLPRRRRSSFKIDDNPSATLKLRSRSVASRSSTSSMRDRVVHFPESPNISLVGSRRSSMIQNRSSIAGPSGGSSGAGSGGEHSSGGWISGISEVMASVSSRVVNTRAQEQLVRSISFSHPEQIESDLADHSRSNQRGSFHSEAVQPSTDVPPWVAVASSIHGVGSDHGSIRNLRRSASKRSSSSHGAAGTANLGAHSSQQDQLGPLHTTGNSRSGSGSHLGKSTQDEESVFTPGGFSHRGSDKMRLEGRSFMLFSPENPVRLWLASILMSKYTDPFILVVILAQWIFFVVTPTTFEAKNVFGTYWTHYGLLAVNILYTLEIMAKAIVYGFIFDRNGFQWKRWVPKRIHHFFISEKRASMKPKPVVLEKHEHAHSLARTNSVLSQASTLEKSKAQTNQATAALTAEEKIESSGSNFETDAQPAHAPFFRSYYNRLDGVVVISYWIDFAFMMTGVQKVYIFKAISALRPLRLLSLTEGTSTIIDSLSMSAPLLLTILGFIFFFFLILSLIGLLVFQGATSRRCAVQDEDDPTSWSPVLPEVICGGYWSNGTILGIVNYVGQGDGDDSSPRSSGMICPEAGITYSFGAVRAEKRHSAFSNKIRSTRTLLDTEEGWQFEDQIHEVRSPFRQWLIRVVNDPWFPIAGTVLVFFDLVVMCFRRYDSSPAALDWINNAETAFTFLFLLEICVRVAGHSTWHQFWKRKSNKFDLFLAITTMIILLPSVQNWEWHRYLTVFQVLRAYRLIPAIPGVRDLMNSVIGSATGMLNLLLITFMFLLVCAPIPMMLFGGEMVSDEEQPVNFDDLGQSFISLFIILTGENWVEIMYEGLDAHQETYKQIYGVIFFVVYYCASHYVLLNLFIAIVLEHFDLDEDEKYKKQLEIYFETHQKAKIDRTRSVFQYLNPYAYLPARPQTLSVNGLSVDQTVSIRKNVFRQFLEGDTAPVTTEIIESKPRLILWLEGIRDYWFPTQAQLEEVNGRKLLSKGQKAQLNQLNGGISGFGKVQDEIDANLERLDADLEKITWDRDRFFEDPQALETLTPEGYRKAKDREKAYADVHYAELQEFLEAHPFIAIIIADDPIDRLLAMTTGDTKKQDILGDIDYVITIIFVVEQSLRILADGFFFTPTAYLRDLWNCTDLFIVLMSCFMTFTHIDHLYNVSRTVRAASCLRVLRIVRYFEGVSAMFKAIAKALPKMVVALLMTALLFWPFAIYGVNIYAGYFYLCNDHGVLTKSECVGEFMSVVNEDTDDEILLPRIWSNPYDYSFDSIQAAVLTLFEMASQEGWVQVLQSGRAAPNRIGQQPFIQPDEPNRFNSFYFLLFMLIGSIVFVQIFIGVILETFKAWNGISLLTVEQRRWLDLRRQLRMIRPTATPIRPQNPIRAFCYDLVNEKKGFLWKIMTTVLALNVCLIASQHYAQPQTLTDIQDVSYFAFLGLYSVEIVIKLLGYGFHK